MNNISYLKYNLNVFWKFTAVGSCRKIKYREDYDCRFSCDMIADFFFSLFVWEKTHTRVLNTLLWNCGGGFFPFMLSATTGTVVIPKNALLSQDSPCFQGYRDVTPVGSASDPHPPSISADDDSLSAFCGSSVGHEIRLPPISYIQRVHTERKQIGGCGAERRDSRRQRGRPPRAHNTRHWWRQRTQFSRVLRAKLGSRRGEDIGARQNVANG